MSEQPTEAKHTPGPWIADGAERIQGTAEQHRYDIARLCPVPFHIVKGDGSVIRRANARLIAAAPDLLAACEAIAAGPIDEPQIDLSGEWQTGLFCGLEDRSLQSDSYAACLYGFEAGVERVLEWAQGIIGDAKAKGDRPCLTKRRRTSASG